MRWQDLKTKPHLKENLVKRAEAFKKIRHFFDTRNFVEMDTPLAVRYGNPEPNLDLFKTEIKNEKGEEFKAYLITSPELSLKKILAGGFSKIYQMSKCFRNSEPWNATHNPEFTLLEWYETGITYLELMERVEELIKDILGKEKMIYQKKEVDLSSPWFKISMREAWQKYAHLDLNNYLTFATMRSLAKEKGYTVNEGETWSDWFFKIFLTEIEPQLVKENRPVFLYDYPKEMAALAKVKEDGLYAERFELYLGGMELANGYGELLNAKEQEKRFKKEEEDIFKEKGEEREMDKDFIDALSAGIAPCAGVAVGVDRIVMLLTDSKDIAEVTPFLAREMYQ